MDEVIRQQRAAADRAVIAELLANGIPCASIFDFVNGPTPPRAVPVLVSLLDRVTDPMILEGVVRALCIKDARGRAEAKLIELFRTLPADAYGGTKWAIGNTLSRLDRQRFSGDLIQLALDAQHGVARQMIVDALGSIRSPEAEAVLIRLLEDDDVNGHAISALRFRKSMRSLAHLDGLREHPNPWKRKSAIKAAAAIRKYYASVN
jgi:HEAT repeat protein